VADVDLLLGRRAVLTGLRAVAEHLDDVEAEGRLHHVADLADLDLLHRRLELGDHRALGEGAEIAAARRGAKLADEGYKVFLNAARPGRADYELVAEVEAFYRANGVDDNFQIIGVGGPEVRGMAPPSGRRLKPGDLVTTELTPCVDGYYCQICRTLVVGPATTDQLAAHALYREAMEAGIAAVRAGVTAADIARAENAVFEAEGYGEYCTAKYTRVRGHGMGLHFDEDPMIWDDVDFPIRAGMVLIPHPNTYLPLSGYMVFGDAVVVTEAGCEVLTGTPRELFEA
jgi:Xaa-Pro aminopeptidase